MEQVAVYTLDKNQYKADKHFCLNFLFTLPSDTSKVMVSFPIALFFRKIWKYIRNLISNKLTILVRRFTKNKYTKFTKELVSRQAIQKLTELYLYTECVCTSVSYYKPIEKTRHFTVYRSVSFPWVSICVIFSNNESMETNKKHNTGKQYNDILFPTMQYAYMQMKYLQKNNKNMNQEELYYS